MNMKVNKPALKPVGFKLQYRFIQTKTIKTTTKTDILSSYSPSPPFCHYTRPVI